VHVHQAGQPPTERGYDPLERRPVRSVPAGPGQHGVGVPARVVRRRVPEVAGQRTSVDLQVPTAAGPAAAAQRAVAERQVPVLAGRAAGPTDRLSADDQRAADAHLDGQVQRGPGTGGRPAAGFGHPGQGGVVADQQRQRRQPGQLHRSPAQGG